LLDIFVYIAQYDTEAASRLVYDIVNKTKWIAASGFSGAPRNELSEGLKALPYRDRCIYFRTDEKAVYILRILHGRRNISSEDFSENSH
jgi:toxin ParE1/3/4